MIHPTAVDTCDNKLASRSERYTPDRKLAISHHRKTYKHPTDFLSTKYCSPSMPLPDGCVHCLLARLVLYWCLRVHQDGDGKAFVEVGPASHESNQLGRLHLQVRQLGGA